MSEGKSIGILYDRVRWEEKEIAHCLKSRGRAVQMIDAKSLALSLSRSGSEPSFPNTVLERCVSFYRGQNVASILEASGTTVVNSSQVLEMCGSKLLTSQLLAKNGVPTPRTIVAFSPEAAIQAVESIGFPCVMKPIIGSWGRQVVPIRDRETAEALIEMRELTNGDSMQSIFYVQEMIDRPPRDIRCITTGEEIIASVYRYASDDSWKTNVALGGRTEPCQVSRELENIVLSAANTMGYGILGIDVMEKRRNGDLIVHEVNGTVEFRGAQFSMKNSIADKIAEYLIAIDEGGLASQKSTTLRESNLIATFKT